MDSLPNSEKWGDKALPCLGLVLSNVLIEISGALDILARLSMCFNLMYVGGSSSVTPQYVTYFVRTFMKKEYFC